MAIIRTKGKGRKCQLLAGVSGQIGKAIVVRQYKGKIVVLAVSFFIFSLQPIEF